MKESKSRMAGIFVWLMVILAFANAVCTLCAAVLFKAFPNSLDEASKHLILIFEDKADAKLLDALLLAGVAAGILTIFCFLVYIICRFEAERLAREYCEKEEEKEPEVTNVVAVEPVEEEPAPLTPVQKILNAYENGKDFVVKYKKPILIGSASVAAAIFGLSIKHCAAKKKK